MINIPEEEIINDIEKNRLNKINDKLYLTNYQEEVLNKYHIDFKNCQDSKELLFILNDIIDDDEYDELEEVMDQISEFSYYNDTHK